MHVEGPDHVRDTRDEARIALRVGRAERDRLSRLAALHDRTLSAEIRRAIRLYLSKFDSVDPALQGQAGKR